MSSFVCAYCAAAFETRKQQWNHTAGCPEAKQAMRDLKSYAGVEDDES